VDVSAITKICTISEIGSNISTEERMPYKKKKWILGMKWIGSPAKRKGMTVFWQIAIIIEPDSYYFSF